MAILVDGLRVLVCNLWPVLEEIALCYVYYYGGIVDRQLPMVFHTSTGSATSPVWFHNVYLVLAITLILGPILNVALPGKPPLKKYVVKAE